LKKTIATQAAQSATPQVKGAAAAAGDFPITTTTCDTDAASCVTKCCIADTAKCGGLVLPATFADATSNYFDKKAQALTAIADPCDTTTTFTPPPADLGTWDDTKSEIIDQKAYAKAWADKAAGADNAAHKAACCLARPTCASHTCPAGKKKKAGLAATTLCATSESCTTDCCQDDTNTCGGIAATSVIKCKYGFYNEMDAWDSKTTQAAKDAFNIKVASAANASTVCLTQSAMRTSRYLHSSTSCSHHNTSGSSIEVQ